MQQLEELNKHDSIVFGPFLGEFGWEVCRWSGFVRWFKRNNPEKEVIVSTRQDRVDLYNGYADKFHLFKLEGDYEDCKPSGVALKRSCSKEPLIKLIKEAQELHPDSYVFTPLNGREIRNMLSFSRMILDVTPRQENIDVIGNLCENKILVIGSRNRIDEKPRNWGIKNWERLYSLIEEDGRYTVFVAGVSPSYCPTRERRNFYNIEDLVRDNTSSVGLTVAAIKKANLTVSSQSGIVILANLLETPVLYWGHEIRRHSKDENPTGNLAIGIYDRRYKIPPERIYKYINKYADGDVFLGRLHRLALRKFLPSQIFKR